MRTHSHLRGLLVGLIASALTLTALVTSGQPAAAATQSTMASGASLAAGSTLTTTSGTTTYDLMMQTDCNLVLYRDTIAVWWTGTSRADAHCRADMQTDGNLVLYTSGNAPLWWTNTAGYSGATLTLQTDGNVVIYRGTSPLWSRITGYIAHRLGGMGFNATLSSGQAIYPPNHQYRLVMQSDCNLVLYTAAGGVVWHAGTVGGTGCLAIAQTDGNFVVYDSSNAPKWQSGTPRYAGAYVTLGDDGRLAVATSSGTWVWSVPAPPAPSGVTARQDLAPAVAAATNAQRVANGIPALAVKTCSAPAAWAMKLATDNVLVHNNLTTVLAACGGGTTAGENIAAGYSSVAAVTAGWMGSSGHRANILNPAYRSIFVGVAQSANGTYYWVENFTG